MFFVFIQSWIVCLFIGTNDGLSVFSIMMALQPSEGTTFFSEPWVWVDRVVDHDDDVGGDIVFIQSHCIDEHEACLKFVGKRGHCLCEQYLFFLCRAEVPIATKTWAVVLSDVFKDMVYTSWGCGSPEKSRDLLSWTLFAVVIRLHDRGDRSSLLSKINGRLINGESVPVMSDELLRFGRVSFSHSVDCCVMHLSGWLPLEEPRKYPNVIFGDTTLFDDVRSLHLGL